MGGSLHRVIQDSDIDLLKPAPGISRLAVDLAGVAPERVLMVAAHAWDLRGAQAVGLRTAYVERPVVDPPASTDSFDHHAGGLLELLTALVGDDR